MPGHELDRPRARGDEAEQHERLVERLRGVVVLADDVVERDDVLEALVLGGRRELADRARVVADLVLREDDADLHARHPVTCAPARDSNLRNACACELLALACRHGHARRPRLPDPVEAALDALARALRASSRRRPRRAARAGRGAQPRRGAHGGPRGPARRGRPGARLRVLDISMSEAGRLFGVSRSAVEQWLRARRPSGAARARSEPRAHRRHPRAQPQARAHRRGRARAGARPTAAKSILDLVREGRDEEARAVLERAFDWSRTA